MINLEALKSNLDLEIENSKAESKDTFRCTLGLANLLSEGLAQAITSTADVEAVRHGVWLHTPRTIADKIYHRWQCSVCARTVATVKRDDITDFPYCHCGAKMDGEGRATE